VVSVVIGISGASASGKTLLAETIGKEFSAQDVVVISEDDYYKDQSHLPLAARAQINYDHPDAIDYKLLLNHITLLRHNIAVDTPVYDYGNHTRSDKTLHVQPSSILILEGILLFNEKVMRDLMDIRVFVDAPLDLCITRRIKRDILERNRAIEYVIKQYQETTRPMFLKYIEPSKKYADIIVPRGGKNRVAVDLIKSKIRDVLQLKKQKELISSV